MLASNNLVILCTFVFEQQTGDATNCLRRTNILGIGELLSFSGSCTQIDMKKQSNHEKYNYGKMAVRLILSHLKTNDFTGTYTTNCYLYFFKYQTILMNNKCE